jgi:cyclopropane-fatty-acyl-phospholipid synthase
VSTYELERPQASNPPAGPWTELPAVPRAPIQAAIARRIFTRAATRLGVTVELPDGRLLVKPSDGKADGVGATPVMHLHRPAQFFRRLGHDGLIGFGESRWYDARQPASDRNDLHGSKSNIARHYDLSNELFALFLDQTMTYSSAIWDEQHGETLAAAQIRKIDRLLDLAAVRPAPGCSRSAPAGANSRSVRLVVARRSPR